MGQVTGIEWCDHTYNPWMGCTKVSPDVTIATQRLRKMPGMGV
jgi:protein gp37